MLRARTIASAGFVVWLAAFAILPAPIAARVLLLAPLVVVPRMLTLLPDRPWIARVAGWPSVVAAVPLIVAFGLPAGPLAAVFVLPWLAIASVCAVAAVAPRPGPPAVHPSTAQPLRPRDRSSPWPSSRWVPGSPSSTASGVQTGFSPTIVLLTATHFHFAGFGLLGLTSLLARTRPTLRVSVVGLIVGIPITAAGFVLVSDPVSAVGALFVGLSGIGAGVALVAGGEPGAAAWPARLAGAALLVGMPMGIAWSLSLLFRLSFLDIDTMIRTHGALNATAVLVATLSYRGGVAS